MVKHLTLDGYGYGSGSGYGYGYGYGYGSGYGYGWTPEQVATTPPYSGNRVSSRLGDEVEIPEELCK